MVLYLGCGGSYTHLHMGHDDGELCTPTAHQCPVLKRGRRSPLPLQLPIDL